MSCCVPGKMIRDDCVAVISCNRMCRWLSNFSIYFLQVTQVLELCYKSGLKTTLSTFLPIHYRKPETTTPEEPQRPETRGGKITPVCGFMVTEPRDDLWMVNEFQVCITV